MVELQSPCCCCFDKNIDNDARCSTLLVSTVSRNDPEASEEAGGGRDTTITINCQWQTTMLTSYLCDMVSNV